MRACVISEERFEQTPDGAVWTDRVHDYEFWSRYLSVFDEVRVVARAREVPRQQPQWKQVDGKGVRVAPVAYYIGPWQFAKRFFAVTRDVRTAVDDDSAVIMRLHSQLANCLEPLLRRRGQPFAVELVTDPHEMFAPGATKNLLRPFFRWWFPRRVRSQCSRACAVSYVTKKTLQQGYPASADAFTTHYSSVTMPDMEILSQARSNIHDRTRIELITVTTLRQLYKAPDLLIDAFSDCVKAGLVLSLTIVGDGRFRPELEGRVARLGMSGRITFTGNLQAGKAVLERLDGADIFVLPSYQEGLPRAMVEAMARALPCIGSTAGGIPELLPDEDMVPAGDRRALADKIKEVVRDPERMRRMSERNLKIAAEYKESVLVERRKQMYAHLKHCMLDWMGSKGRNPS